MDWCVGEWANGSIFQSLKWSTLTMPNSVWGKSGYIQNVTHSIYPRAKDSRDKDKNQWNSKDFCTFKNVKMVVA